MVSNFWKNFWFLKMRLVVSEFEITSKSPISSKSALIAEGLEANYFALNA